MNFNALQELVTRLAKNRWVAWAGLMAAGLIAMLAMGNWGSRPVPVAHLNPGHKPATELALLDRADELLIMRDYGLVKPGATNAGPISTDYFKPPAPPKPPPDPPKPPPPPPPPPPIKVPVIYQGYFQNSAGQRLAYLSVGGSNQSLTNGAVTTGGLALVEFDLHTAVLQNTNQTNVLKFSVPTEILIPPK